MMETDIDLILPVYNPDEGWELTVVSKYKELEVLWKHADIHLYVVNDGSARGFEKVVTDYIRQNIPEVHILSYSIKVLLCVKPCLRVTLIISFTRITTFLIRLILCQGYWKCYSEELMWLYRLGIRLIMIVYRFLVV